MADFPNKAFGKSVYRLRMKAKLTQEELAEAADISRRFLQEIEAGQKNPTINVAHRIRRAFRCSWDELLGN